MHAEQVLRRIDVAQREQRQRRRHLLIENEEEDRLDRQHEGGDESGFLVAMTFRDEVSEDAEHRDRRDDDEGARDVAVLQDDRRDHHDSTPKPSTFSSFVTRTAARPDRNRCAPSMRA